MSTAPDSHPVWPPPDTKEVREALARAAERRAESASTELARRLLYARAAMLREGAPFESDEHLLAELDNRRGRG